jgi:hypothetical protein
MPFDLGVTLVEHAEWLSGHDRIQDAEPLVAEAGMIFDGVRANPWIERTSRLVPQQDDGAMAEVTPAPNPTPVT